MDLSKIPLTARVNKGIPKNAFEHYTNSKQKKLFTDRIARITWLYKLSPDTINLEFKEIKEIQIFKVELKIKEDVQALLDIIDKSIPYHIIFVVEWKESIYLSTSPKHPHPVNEDNAVIDWTFKTSWFSPNDNVYVLRLKKSLDAVYHDFCIQLSGKLNLANKSFQDLIDFKKEIDTLEKEIVQLQKSIKNCKHYKNKVELNLLLKQKTKQMKKLVSE